MASPDRKVGWVVNLAEGVSACCFSWLSECGEFDALKREHTRMKADGEAELFFEGVWPGVEFRHVPPKVRTCPPK